MKKDRGDREGREEGKGGGTGAGGVNGRALAARTFRSLAGVPKSQAEPEALPNSPGRPESSSPSLAYTPTRSAPKNRAGLHDCPHQLSSAIFCFQSSVSKQDSLPESLPLTLRSYLRPSVTCDLSNSSEVTSMSLHPGWL